MKPSWATLQSFSSSFRESSFQWEAGSYYMISFTFCPPLFIGKNIERNWDSSIWRLKGHSETVRWWMSLFFYVSSARIKEKDGQWLRISIINIIILLKLLPVRFLYFLIKKSSPAYTKEIWPGLPKNRLQKDSLGIFFFNKRKCW